MNTKFLGVIIDSKLNWAAHILYIKNKISKSIGMMPIDLDRLRGESPIRILSVCLSVCLYFSMLQSLSLPSIVTLAITVTL